MTLEIARRWTGTEWHTAPEQEGGGGGAASLLGPFAVTYQTAGLSNPGDNGALVGPEIPAGTLVLLAWLNVTTPFVAATSVDELIISLNTSSSALLDIPNSSFQDASFQVLGTNNAAPLPVFVRTGTEQLAVALYSTGALSAGEADVYALTAAI